jgi:hypothetical protein
VRREHDHPTKFGLHLIALAVSGEVLVEPAGVDIGGDALGVDATSGLIDSPFVDVSGEDFGIDRSALGLDLLVYQHGERVCLFTR